MSFQAPEAGGLTCWNQSWRVCHYGSPAQLDQLTLPLLFCTLQEAYPSPLAGSLGAGCPDLCLHVGLAKPAAAPRGCEVAAVPAQLQQ